MCFRTVYTNYSACGARYMLRPCCLSVCLFVCPFVTPMHGVSKRLKHITKWYVTDLSNSGYSAMQCRLPSETFKVIAALKQNTKQQITDITNTNTKSCSHLLFVYTVITKFKDRWRSAGSHVRHNGNISEIVHDSMSRIWSIHHLNSTQWPVNVILKWSVWL